MKVQDIMTRNVVVCHPETNLAKAAALMWDNDCGVLPVVRDGGKLAGIITDRDLALAMGTKNRIASDIKVDEVMAQNVFACSPDDDIHQALMVMSKDKVRRLPITDEDGRLIGLISINDIALQAQQGDDASCKFISYADVVSTFKAICEHNPAKRIETEQALVAQAD
jgi:CBS domain-containing protein